MPAIEPTTLPTDPRPNLPETGQKPREIATSEPCHARVRNDRSAAAPKSAEIREKRPAVSRMDSFGIKLPVTHDQEDRADLKAFRREVRTKSVDELRIIYAEEDGSHRGMLAREREGTAVVHPKVRPFKGYLLAFGPKPDPSCTLDRIDPTNPLYGPGLCRWATPKEQARNRTTTNVLTDLDGRTMTLPEWAELTGTDPATMRQRVAREWPDYEVIHGRAAKSPATEVAVPAQPDHWPAISAFRKTAIWDRAFGRFEATFAPIGPATRPVMVAWFAGPHLRAHEAAYDRVHGWEREPGEVDQASATLRNLRAAMTWARQGMTPEERAFIGYLDTTDLRLRSHQEHVEALRPAEVTREDREELRRLQHVAMVADTVKRMLPAPAAPPPPASDADRPRMVAWVPATTTQRDFDSARRARADADRARQAAAQAKADAMGLPRIPDFEDLDAPFPEHPFGAVDPNDPDLIGWRRRPAPAADQDDDAED